MPACSQRGAGEGELLLGLTEHDGMVPEPEVYAITKSLAAPRNSIRLDNFHVPSPGSLSRFAQFNTPPCAGRKQQFHAPRRALTQGQFARSPNRFTLTMLEARNRRTRYIIERWSPRAGAVVRARRLRAVAGTGPRLPLSNVPLRGPLTALARDGGPTSSEAGSAVGPPGLSNVLRARGPAPES